MNIQNLELSCTLFFNPSEFYCYDLICTPHILYPCSLVFQALFFFFLLFPLSLITPIPVGIPLPVVASTKRVNLELERKHSDKVSSKFSINRKFVRVEWKSNFSLVHKCDY